jgi:hypothetical protein
MTKGKSYQRYPAEFKRMALLKASEEALFQLLAQRIPSLMSRFKISCADSLLS